MIKQRSFAVCIILSCITFGIYSIIFWYGWTEDVNKVCIADNKPSMNYILVVLLSLFTFGIYGLFWAYQQQNRLYAVVPDRAKNDVKSGGTVLLWYILGSFILIGPLVGSYYMVKALNSMAVLYNNKIAGGAVPPVA